MKTTYNSARVMIGGKTIGNAEFTLSDGAAIPTIDVTLPHEVDMHASLTLDKGAFDTFRDAVDAAFKAQDEMRAMIDQAKAHIFSGPGGVWVAKRASAVAEDTDTWLSGRFVDRGLNTDEAVAGSRIDMVARAYRMSGTAETTMAAYESKEKG